MAAKRFTTLLILIAAVAVPTLTTALVPPSETCEGSCGDQSPFGCFCDDLCTLFNDCCSDAVELCLTFPPSPPAALSPPVVETCEGSCGGQSPFGCFCDDLCTAFNDCCPDAVELCLAIPPSPPVVLSPPVDVTCEGSCGGQSPFGCFCDDLCTLFDDCCPDAVELCLTLPPSPPVVLSPPVVVTCEGSCGGQSPFGCFCDDLCTLFNDCCPDAVELCLTLPPSPPVVLSPPVDETCEDSCGGQSPFGCFCDDLCTSFDDCCPDAVELCLTVPPSPPVVLSPPVDVTCEGSCGGVSPFGCFCDDLCTFYDDCCPDAVELCLGVPPSPPPSVSPPPPSPPPALIFPPGDVNFDGAVTVADVVLVSNSILGIAPLSGAAFDQGDINQDGDLTVADIVAIINIILGI